MKSEASPRLEKTVSNTCAATTRSGENCQAFPIHGSAYCFTHDPAVSDARQSARRLGGQRGRRASPEDVRLQSVEDVRLVLETTFGDTLRLANSVKRNRAIGYLASVMLKVLELSALESRVQALEESQSFSRGERRTNVA